MLKIGNSPLGYSPCPLVPLPCGTRPRHRRSNGVGATPFCSSHASTVCQDLGADAAQDVTQWMKGVRLCVIDACSCLRLPAPYHGRFTAESAPGTRDPRYLSKWIWRGSSRRGSVHVDF